MELTVFERLIAGNILPKEGDFPTLKIIRKLKENLSWDEDELESLDFHEEYKCGNCEKLVKKPILEPAGLCKKCGSGLVKTGQIFWNQDADKPTEIEIGKKATAVLARILEDLSDKEQLKEEHYSLYVKFVGDEE